MPFRAPDAPRPPPKVKISDRLKKAGGTLVAKTGAMRIKISQKASNLIKRFKRNRGTADTQDVGAGHRDAPTDGDVRTPEQKTKQNENDPNSQHSPEGKERTKKSFMERAKTGATAGLMLLPFAILLAATIQGAIDCDNIDKMIVDITDVNSAAWPEYPDWWPEWLPAPQKDTNKVWISYSPAVHFLMTDTINITTSNTAGEIQTSISGEHSILNNEDDTVTLIQLAEAFDSTKEDFSNIIAKADITTSCEDRMAYAAGQDVKAIGEAASTGLGAFTDAIPWKTILYVVVFLAAVWLLFQAVSILRT